MALSYNGWPASRDPNVININKRWEPVPGHDFPGGIRSGDVEVVMTYLVQQLNQRVEAIVEYPAGDEWGYSYRANVNNPASLSCHSSGTAIDYNATQHPNQVKYTWTQEQAREIHEILDELGGVVRWLEGYDEMHFEIRGTPLQVKAVARKLQNPPAPIPKPPPPPEDDDVRMIVKGDQRPGIAFITDGITKRHVDDVEEAAALVIRGLAKWDAGANGGKGGAYVWKQAQVDDITTVPRGKTLANS